MDINITVTSALISTEKRVSLNWDLRTLREKLEKITGIAPEDQKLLLFRSTHSSDVEELTGDGTLGSFNVTPQARIHVVDTSDTTAHLLDDKVDKFELTEEEYSARTDSVRQWKKANNLGKYNEEREAHRLEMLEKNKQIAQNIPVGARCKISPGDRLGTVKFVGSVPEIDNEVWVGVELDEPTGKNDGSVKGVRYFTCPKNYGSFTRPGNVEIGDFAQEDELDLDEDEI